MMNTKKVEKLFFKTTFRCIEHIISKEYMIASTIAKAKKNQCKRIILSDKEASPQIKNIALIFGIFFKALEELSELCSIISNYNWIYNLKYVERVWFLLQSCNERFGGVILTLNLPENVSRFIKETLQDVEIQIEKEYGTGLFLSPEVIVSDSVCSICNQEPRSCTHIPNQVYDGEICRIIPTEIMPGGGIVVTSNPKDKRCRIWEIQENTNGIGYIAKNVRFLVSFRIDDFLYDESNASLVCDFNLLIDFEELKKLKDASARNKMSSKGI